MTFKPNKRLVWICGFSIALVVLLMAAGAFVLPAYLQSGIIPRLAAGFGLETEEVHVRRLGLWGADLGPIRLKARNAPVLTLAAVQIDYTPWTLLHGRIEGITLGGVGLALAVTADGLSIGGYQLPARNSSAPKTGAVPDLDTLLPIQLTHFSLSESRLDVDWNGQRTVIPLDIRLETAELGRGVLRGRARLSILGNTVRVAAAVDQHANSASLKIDCDRFLLESLSQISAAPAGLKASGALGLSGRATVQLKPLAISSLDISGRLTEARVATPHGSLKNMVTAQGDSQPIGLSVSAQAPDRFQYACGPLEFDGPVKAAVAAVKGAVARSDPGWSLTARVDTLVPGQTLDSGLTWEKELPVIWQLEAAQGAEKVVSFKVSASGGQRLAVGLEPFRLTGEGYQVDVKGHVADRRIEAQALLAAGGLRITFPDGAVTVPGARISGTMAVGASPLPSKITARAVISKVRSQVRSAVLTLPEIQIDAEGQSDRSTPWAFGARLKIPGGRMQDKAHDVTLQGFDLDLPLQWPPVAEARAGRLGLQALQYKGRQLGGAKGTLQQDVRNLEVRLEHRSKLFAGLIVLVKSRLNAQGIHAHIDVPAYRPAQAVDLGRFFPAAAGILADGRIEAHGAVAVVNGETRGRADLKIDQGTVDQVDRKLRLEGIALALQINDIAALKSAPRQKLQVEKLQFGNLAAQNLDVDFQLEDRQTLFLEKVGLQWCQGRVNAAAVRIIPGKEDYDVTLFCDRLNLAMVLEQLGAAQAGGEGTVNGRIPLRWVDGRLSFDNGFLYSTPGQPGQIQLAGTEALLAGMPPGSPQHTQLDIATEALKDYTYQWAKLSVQSQKDVLLLKLQLDGKPNRLLPFAYDQQLGQFKRITGEGQAEFKGISIDLNFKSPLNEIIHYKEFLNRN